MNLDSILDSETRHSGGIHFTSREIIHQTIDPLLANQNLDDVIFFDPACGSGNFLLEILRSYKISADQLIGIELNDFSACVARVLIFLEAKKFPRIIHGNSLRIDWKKIVQGKQIYIVGNPPFLGYSLQNSEQRSDVRRIFNGWGKFDYAACWFKKAAEFMIGKNFETAFVATSSICQGEHVSYLWQKLFEIGIKINFARKNFRWDLEANVYCAIIGFSFIDRDQKFIDGMEVQNINGYLLNAPNIFVEPRRDPICDVPRMLKGSQPTGDFIVEENFEPHEFVRPLIGAEEFLKNRSRFCLWLQDAPQEILEIPAIKSKIESIKNFRLSSPKKSTRDSAKTPWLFQEIRQPATRYLAVPRVSTSIREYLPIGFVDSKVVATDALLIVPNANLWLFGILSSKVHMAWLRIVCGRLGSGYRYSVSGVYNNFPFPKSNPKIEVTAQKILDARDSNKSLAELYDPNSMPFDLKNAHYENDKIVLDSYGFSESEIVSRLFEMYQNLTSRK